MGLWDARSCHLNHSLEEASTFTVLGPTAAGDASSPWRLAYKIFPPQKGYPRSRAPLRVVWDSSLIQNGNSFGSALSLWLPHRGFQNNASIEFLYRNHRVSSEHPAKTHLWQEWKCRQPNSQRSWNQKEMRRRMIVKLVEVWVAKVHRSAVI